MLLVSLKSRPQLSFELRRRKKNINLNNKTIRKRKIMNENRYSKMSKQNSFLKHQIYMRMIHRQQYNTLFPAKMSIKFRQKKKTCNAFFKPKFRDCNETLVFKASKIFFPPFFSKLLFSIIFLSESELLTMKGRV